VDIVAIRQQQVLAYKKTFAFKKLKKDVQFLSKNNYYMIRCFKKPGFL